MPYATSGSQPVTHSIAYFISPHGFGHAARAAAIMAALQALNPAVRFEIFTQVPAWFFRESLRGPFGYHAVLTDIGLVQKNSLVEDIPETFRRLDELLPFDPVQVEALAGQIRRLDCKVVMCDIAPLGIVVARQAGLRAILVENFTWDWIYQGYAGHYPQIDRHIAYLSELFALADDHIQVEPICRLEAANLTTPPVSRQFRTTPEQVRHVLGIDPTAKMVMLTMGGTGWDYSFLELVEQLSEIYFVVAGSSQPAQAGRNLIMLPKNGGIFHPDLINASDAVIGKAGYSTLAEVYQAGVPFGYISRANFRESAVLEQFIATTIPHLPLTEAQIQNGQWLAKVPELLSLSRVSKPKANGADLIARFLIQYLQ